MGKSLVNLINAISMNGQSESLENGRRITQQILESRQQSLKSFTEKKAYAMKWQFKGNVGPREFFPQTVYDNTSQICSNDEKNRMSI